MVQQSWRTFAQQCKNRESQQVSPPLLSRWLRQMYWRVSDQVHYPDQRCYAIYDVSIWHHISQCWPILMSYLCHVFRRHILRNSAGPDNAPDSSSPAWWTIKQYHSGTIFLDESSRPYLHVSVYIAARVNRNKQSYGVTAVGLSLALHHTRVNFTPISSTERAVSFVASTMASNKNYQQSSTVTIIHEKILILAILTVRKDYKA